MIWTIIYLTAIAHVWSRGTIFAPLRTRGPAWWIALADCPLCSGWWIGAIGLLVSCLAPSIVTALGIASLVGTLSLAVYGLIRRI